MQHIPLNHLVQLQSNPATDAAFVITLDKSTFIQVAENDNSSSHRNLFWAFLTSLCSNSSLQYNPFFVMAVLSVTPFEDQLETLNQIQLPKVLFVTTPEIRRSMTVNAMRMSTELFEVGSERVFQLARQRLEANQTDVVHDLLVYLMHAILGARHEYTQEKILRAESIAAYLGISPTKVLLLLNRYNESSQLTEYLLRGDAGKLQRELNVAALVRNQLELLSPYQQNAFEKEIMVIEAVGRVVELWKDY
ncbi:MAG: hypothetical protein ABI210_02750 [Abditibacteriaceae bacterium]